MSQESQPAPPQSQQMASPRGMKPRNLKKKKQEEPAPFKIHTFTTNMESLDDASRYPVYCRKGDKEKVSHPLERARIIYNMGHPVPLAEACTYCLEHGQICIRAPKFSKCCYCTAEDLHPKEMCHLQGVADPPKEMLSMTALSKKRKMDARTEAVTAHHTFVKTYGQSQFQISSPAKRARTESPVFKPVSTKPHETATQETSTELQGASRSMALGPLSVFAEQRIKVLENKVGILETIITELRSKGNKPDTCGQSEAETISTMSPATTQDYSWNSISDILRAHDKEGNLIQGIADIQMAN